MRPKIRSFIAIERKYFLPLPHIIPFGNFPPLGQCWSFSTSMSLPHKVFARGWCSPKMLLWEKTLNTYTSRCQQIPGLESYISCAFSYKCSFLLIQTPAFFFGLLPVLLCLAEFLFFPPHQGRAAHCKMWKPAQPQPTSLQRTSGFCRLAWPICVPWGWSLGWPPCGGTAVLLSLVVGKQQVIYSAILWLNDTLSLSTVSTLCLLGADTRTARIPDAGPILADTLRKFLFDLDVDDGLAAIGYSKADIPALVKGTLPQVRDVVCPHSLPRSTKLLGKRGPFGVSWGKGKPRGPPAAFRSPPHQTVALLFPCRKRPGSPTFIFFHKTGFFWAFMI